MTTSLLTAGLLLFFAQEGSTAAPAPEAPAAAPAATETSAAPSKEPGLPTLTPAQYSTVYNMFSFTIASMGASALFFFLSRNQLAPKYRPAMMVSGLVVSIACYHYFRIFESWEAAYELTGGQYVPTGAVFNDAYRYADWLLTVPLLMVELIAVLALPKGEGRGLLVRLSVAAFFMIALGYPGEIAKYEAGAQYWIFFVLSMIPFLYILFVLLTELTKSLERQPENVRGYISAARLIVLVSWCFYPIAYLASGVGGLSGAQAEVGLQVGYTIADIVAKAVFGVYIYFIARTKSENEGYEVSAQPAVATA
ncbi:rhodopsin [Isosphaera pallida ATCC 43644]|uniref:Rhodopsin n=1 Tax=Isosphaera pallida (strain ATCC 43644 / DSM 9630 / IS1B) TaxID=575540 RepID=E8QX23_ISOPI|nr:bacteriorhodopsin-like [Isosphaera pallida]ADV64062.1 rhodopsin [Isosphaera pallida ATCC 43644]